MSDREVKTRQTFEEWARSNFDYSAPLSAEVTRMLERGCEHSWNAALASVILPEGRFDIPPAQEWHSLDNQKPIGFAVYGFPTLHEEDEQPRIARTDDGVFMTYLGYIARPLPKTVGLTVEEKIDALGSCGLSWRDIAVLTNSGKTLDQLCSEFGVSTTKELS